jgi:hypothetical protein
MPNWLRNHRGTFGIVIIGLLLSAAQGGRTLTKMLATGASEYDARLVANRTSALFMVAYIVAVLLLWGVSKLFDRVLSPRS